MSAKFSRRSRCQPGCNDRYQSSSVGLLPRRSTDDGVRWNTYSSFACSPTNGTAWMAVQPVPIIPIRLSHSLVNPPEWSPPV